MDYFGRLRQLASPRPQSPAEKRSQALEKVTRHFTMHSMHEDQLARGLAHTPIPKALQVMCDQLIKEHSLYTSRSPSADRSTSESQTNDTGVCFEYALKNGCCQLLADMASADFPQGMFKETLIFFTTLVEMIGKPFLAPYAVHQPIMKLLRACEDETIARNYDEEVVDLGYSFCAQIRSNPEMIFLFLLDQNLSRSSSKESLASNKEDAAEVRPNYDFTLFSLLIKFVGKSGKVGDYARTGLLFLIEVDNSISRQYILNDYNLPQVLINMISNIFTQLPQRLDSYTSSIHALQKLSLNNVSLVPPSPAEKSLVRNSQVYNIDTKQELADGEVSDLTTFINVLTFIDTIVQKLGCVADGLPDLFETQFLHETLVPAYRDSFTYKNSFIVISVYLENILTTITSKILLERVIINIFGQVSTSLRSILLEMVTTSSEEAVIQAILKLLYVLFDKHGQFASPLLISSLHATIISPSILNDLHGRFIDRYLPFLPSFSHYDDYVTDAFSIVPSLTSNDEKIPSIESLDSLKKVIKDVGEDVFLQTVLTLLDHFWDHSPATNLLVTGLVRGILLQPYCLVYLYMTSGDELNDVRSLFTVLRYLYSKVDAVSVRKKYVDIEKVNANGSWVRLNANDATEKDIEKVNTLNVLILDEFVKEVVGCMQAQAMSSE